MICCQSPGGRGQGGRVPKKTLRKPPQVLAEGRALCIHEPRDGAYGLEGYNLGETYRYQLLQGTAGRYVRVYPGTGSESQQWSAYPNYYETCGPDIFQRFFKEL